MNYNKPKLKDILDIIGDIDLDDFFEADETGYYTLKSKYVDKVDDRPEDLSSVDNALRYK